MVNDFKFKNSLMPNDFKFKNSMLRHKIVEITSKLMQRASHNLNSYTKFIKKKMYTKKKEI